jgi:hypothetical protein
MTKRVVDILKSRRNDGNESAPGGAKARQDWWADTLKLKPDELQEDEEAATADAEGLRPRS